MIDTNPIDSKSFSDLDQESFADYSGDFNPIHMDSIYARRCIAGYQIVHGMHMVIWALDSAARSGLFEGTPEKLKVEFLSSARLNHPVSLYHADGPEKTDIKLLIKDEVGGLLSKISFTTFKDKSNDAYEEECYEIINSPVRSLDDLKHYQNRFKISFRKRHHKELWPNLRKVSGDSLPLFLATTSRLVGMDCPGLNSLYLSLELNSNLNHELSSDELRYAVKRTDHRFSLVDIECNSSKYVGEIRAFVRPNPVQQPSIADVYKLVPRNYFLGKRALIIGGSRGIGESISKVFASGGGNVCFTYYKGLDDAEKLLAELKTVDSSASAERLNVLNDDLLYEKILRKFMPTSLYYCATPYIFEGKRGVFSKALLDTFLEYYSTKFDHYARRAIHFGVRQIWYPSTVAISERPPDMVEYVLAKAMGESTVKTLANDFPDIRISAPRLPRTATDQTSSLLGVSNEPTIHVVLNSIFV